MTKITSRIIRKSFSSNNIYYIKNYNRNLKSKENNLEDKRKALHEEEKKILLLSQSIEEKAKVMSAKYDEIENLRTEWEIKVKKLDEEKIVTANYLQKLKDEIVLLEEKSLSFDRQKDDFLRKFQSFENEKQIINMERIKVEQNKTEMRLRMQSLEVKNYLTNLVFKTGIASE